jgi:hypothetical protein
MRCARRQHCATVATFARQVEQAAVQKILEAAQEAVDAASIKGDLRPVAFDKAVDLLAGVPAARGPLLTGGEGDAGGSENGGGEGAPATDKAKAIAKKMHITADNVEKVYDLDDDVSISVQRSKLSSDRANATLDLALLYAGARQAAYGDTTTNVTDVRSLVDNFGVLDGKNFSSTLNKKKNWFTIKGSGKSRTLKVTSAGYEDAGKRIVELLGGGS